MNLSAVVLAAGKGTRMKSSLPKVMHKIAGKAMIWHTLKMLEESQIEDSTVVIGHDADILKKYLLREFSDVKKVTQQERLGTAHAANIGIESIEDKQNNIAILFGDTPFIEGDTLYKMNDMLNNGAEVVVLSFIPTNPSNYGRLIVNGYNELEEIVEYSEANEEERDIKLCNSGVMLLSSKSASLITQIKNENSKKEFYLTDIVKIAKQNKLKVTHFTVDETEVLGINSKKDLANAEMVIQNKIREKMFEDGVTLRDPESIFFSADTKVGSDSVIGPNVYFGTGVIVHNNVEIKSFSHIEGAEIASGAIIGPFARIRRGTNISQDVKIGNFVETKNSDIGKNSKISHLSYIGDSQIGEDVNIGAGTITCNYDGYNKFRTEIEDNVFVGSNSSLVAPLSIGKGSIIGAGSVVTKNSPENSLIVSRGEEKSFLGKAPSLRSKAKKVQDQINKGKKL